MYTNLTQEDIDEYQENGFVVIENFLDADELADWRAQVDGAIDARGKRKMANSDAESGDSYYDNVFIQRLNLWMDHAGMRRLMLDARIGKMAAALAGVEGSFHNGLLAHGAGANMTPGLRRAMTCAYMPDGSTFNGQKNVLTGEYVSTLSEGDVLENDVLNPLIYHPSKELVTA